MIYASAKRMVIWRRPNIPNLHNPLLCLGYLSMASHLTNLPSELLSPIFGRLYH